MLIIIIILDGLKWAQVGGGAVQSKEEKRMIIAIAVEIEIEIGIRIKIKKKTGSRYV